MRIRENQSYNAKEVAKLLKLHRDTVYEKIRKDEIKAKNISSGNRPEYRILGKWILEYLEN